MTPTEVAIAVVVQGGRVLVCKREQAPLAGYWEFPGGKVEPGETPVQAAIREVAEEVGIAVRVVRAMTPRDHVYPHGAVRLHPFVCVPQEPHREEASREARHWITLDDLPAYEFPPANEGVLRELLQILPKELS